MVESLKKEVDQNYDFFQRNMLDYLEQYSGKYALIKSMKIIGFFDNPGEAYREGLSRFSDKIFSIQKVDNEPVDLGLMSLAVA